MKVVKHVADHWTLFEQGRELFLKVHTGKDAFAYTVLLRLDGDETYAYRTEGLDFVEKYARAIDTSLLTKGKQSPVHSRDVAALYAGRAAEALEDWLAKQPAPEPEPEPAPPPVDEPPPTPAA
jgi:hypothetical protein